MRHRDSWDVLTGSMRAGDSGGGYGGEISWSRRDGQWGWDVTR